MRDGEGRISVERKEGGNSNETKKRTCNKTSKLRRTPVLCKNRGVRHCDYIPLCRHGMRHFLHNSKDTVEGVVYLDDMCDIRCSHKPQ